MEAKIFRLIGIVLTAVFILSPQARSGDEHLLGLGIGAGGIVDDHKMLYGCLEYRSPAQFYNLKPWASLEFSDRFFYGAAGLLVDFKLTDHLLFTPSLGAGFYSQENGVELGHPLEFRSAAELSWRFTHSGRLAVSFGHVSNGGLDDTNPGSEMLKITCLLPFGKS